MHIALNYGGRDEIIRAVKKISHDIKNGEILESDINEKMFGRYLDTNDIPDPDLLIRTSGEMRISNFLLWQLAYSEMYFCNKLWPDFSKKDLIAAIEFYNERNRTFGGRA